MSFREQLKKARTAKGFTQQQMAELIGITPSTYCGYETGKREPSINKIKDLARVLGVSVDLLYYGEEPDREYENLLDVLDAAGLSIEATGFMDNYYIWHTDAENPEEDRVELEYAKLLTIVSAASAAAELRKDEFLRKRLDADIF